MLASWAENGAGQRKGGQSTIFNAVVEIEIRVVWFVPYQVDYMLYNFSWDARCHGRIGRGGCGKSEKDLENCRSVGKL